MVDSSGRLGPIWLFCICCIFLSLKWTNWIISCVLNPSLEGSQKLDLPVKLNCLHWVWIFLSSKFTETESFHELLGSQKLDPLGPVKSSWSTLLLSFLVNQSSPISAHSTAASKTYNRIFSNVQVENHIINSFFWSSMHVDTADLKLDWPKPVLFLRPLHLIKWCWNQTRR